MVPQQMMVQVDTPEGPQMQMMMVMMMPVSSMPYMPCAAGSGEGCSLMFMRTFFTSILGMRKRITA